jgi:multidrug efflux pump
VLFGLVMGLGLLVDDGIVVVDNVFANMKKGMPRVQASKIGIGEIAWPVISSTATTLMAFLPFALWPGTMGKFMIYFPITLTVTLTASLFVAMVVNAAMTGGSMDTEDKNVSLKTAKKYTIILAIIGVLFVVSGNINDSKFARGIGHLALISLGLMWLYKWKMYQWTQDFQHSFFPRLEEKYKRFLRTILNGRNAWLALVGIIGDVVFIYIFVGAFSQKSIVFS